MHYNKCDEMPISSHKTEELSENAINKGHCELLHGYIYDLAYKFTSLFVRSAHTYMWYEEQNLKQIISLYNQGCVSGS